MEETDLIIGIVIAVIVIAIIIYNNVRRAKSKKTPDANENTSGGGTINPEDKEKHEGDQAY